MFRCHECGIVVPAGIPSHKVIIEKRRKEYPFRPKAIPQSIARKKKKRFKDDKGGMGWERVKEVMMCPTCATAWAQKEAAEAPMPTLASASTVLGEALQAAEAAE